MAANFLDETIVFPVAEAIDFLPDYIRIYLVFILQYPLGWIMYYFVHGTIARHLYCITVGVLIACYRYGWDVLHIIFLYGGAHIIM